MSRALLVIDMLNDFIDKKGALFIGNTEEIMKNVSSRLQKWQAQGDPIIYIMDRHLPGDAEFKMFPPHCLCGEWGSRVIESLAPREKDFQIYKRRYSAFYGTDLDLTLRELGVTELELAGVCTQICILYTAADARMRQYDVTVRKNCVASFDVKAHEFALIEMAETLGVKVI